MRKEEKVDKIVNATKRERERKRAKKKVCASVCERHSESERMKEMYFLMRGERLN